MPSNQTVLITGASRGIGRGLTTHYLATPSTTVIAAVRTPSAPASTLLLLPMDASSLPSITAALATLPTAHHITHLTLVIANAASGGPVGPLAAVDPAALRGAVDATAFGALWLWRGCLGMLRAGEGKFVAVGSDMGSVGLLGATGGVPLGAYGAGKALLNYLVARAAVEEPGVVSFVVHPGSVDTEGARKVIEELGLDAKPMPVEESVAAVAKIIANATKDTSGRFLSYTGEEMPW